MLPKSLSATALQTANLCLSRYHAENIKRGRGIDNTAALLGTSCHNALEMYVKTKYLGEGDHNPDLPFLLDLYKMSYMETFATSDLSGDLYEEGLDMLKRWFKRTDFDTFTVVSAEVKTSFPVKTSAGPIPFNYIWDRHDMLDGDVPRVVDYKTNRMPESPQSLKKKVQARCYGVAAQIKYPHAERIWIEFDMLRHDGPVAISFTRDENIAAWRFIKDTAERILAADEKHLPETLNTQCTFCVRKGDCDALFRNVNADGIFSKTTIELVDVRAQMEYQQKALKSAIDEIDSVILGEAQETDVFEFESETHRLDISSSRRRAVDSERVEMVIGPQLFQKYGSSKITLAEVTKLLKGDEITDEQRKALTNLITYTYSSASVKVSEKSVMD